MSPLRLSAFILTLAFCGVNQSAAFVTPTSAGHAVAVKTELASTESPETSYGEESRKFRRTVYSHDDWVKHRSPNRFFRNLSSFPQSGIYKNLGREVLATVGVASFIVTWNCLFGEYQDFGSVTHAGPFKDSIIPILSLPLAPFTLASPSLGLLLGELEQSFLYDQDVSMRICGN